MMKRVEGKDSGVFIAITACQRGASKRYRPLKVRRGYCILHADCNRSDGVNHQRFKEPPTPQPWLLAKRLRLIGTGFAA